MHTQVKQTVMHRHRPPPHALSAGRQKETWTDGLAAVSDSDSEPGLLKSADEGSFGSSDGNISGSEDDEGGGWVDGLASLREGEGATALLDSQKQTSTQEALENVLKANKGASEEFEEHVNHDVKNLVDEVLLAGEAFIEVGTPNGWGPTGLDKPQLALVLARLEATADEAGCDVVVMRQRSVVAQSLADSSLHKANANKRWHTADVAVQRRAGMGTPLEVRVAVIGNVDSGKSTVVGVLTRSVLDDGRGLARSKVFKHEHEGVTGRTSSIGQHNLCLDSRGNILNDSMFRSNSSGDYVSRAAKVITLVDLAGHERYFKTTAYGLTGHLPDYACLIVGANAGIVGMCKEHLGVALALKVPVFFMVTKVDICPEHVRKHTLESLQTILKKPGVKKRPFIVRSKDDVLTCARHIHSDALAPIFLTSSVTGQGLDLVRLFYSLLPQRRRWHEHVNEPVSFLIDEVFSVPGVGTVVAGTLKAGTILPNTTLMMGPDIGNGKFFSVGIKSIHYKRLPVGKVVAGQTAALALKKIKRAAVRKGMVLVDSSLKAAASWEFDAEIAILTHSTTIAPKYQAVIHCEIVRQAATVVAMDRERLRSGDRAHVRFRFLQRPEYLTPRTRFVFREGRTKGIGLIVGPVAD